jgi:hypothetical protein
MSKSGQAFLLFAILFWMACGSRVNAVVVEEVDKEVQVATESVTNFKTASKQFTDFKVLVEHAPSSVREAAGGRVEEMAQMISEYAEKTAVNVEPLEAMLKEAQQFEADYAAGKIEPEVAKTQLAQIKANLSHVNQTSQEFQAALAAFRSEYKKMVEEALAKPAKSGKK